MVTEVPRPRTAAEQPVHGADIGRNLLADIGTHLQTLDLLTNGFGQTCCSLAGGRCETNAQWPALLDRRSLQQGQQAHHRGGLAGAGPPGDDAEAGAGGQGTGQFLPIHLACHSAFVKQLRKACRQVCGRGFVLAQAPAQGFVYLPLITPVAAQVEALTADHQWPGVMTRGIASSNQGAGGNALAPGVQVEVGEQLRR
ncbi:hypothetical protein D3C81_1120620 [compost metagenome]